MDFLNMDLPPEEEGKSITENFISWLDSMNNQMERIDKSKHKSDINKVLTNNGISPLEID